MKVTNQNLVSILLIVFLMLTFSCKEEEEEEETSIYKEELFTDKNWKQVSIHQLRKVNYYYSSGTTLTIVKTYLNKTTPVEATCENDYTLNFSSDTSYLKKITGSTYCDTYVPASSVEKFAQWYIVHGKIVVNYDEEYYESIHGITYDEIQNKYYELLSLNDTSMTLQRTISGDDLGVYLNTTTQVKGSIVFTLKYINDNANSFDNLKRSDDLPSTNVQTSNNDMLKNNITSPF